MKPPKQLRLVYALLAALVLLAACGPVPSTTDGTQVANLIETAVAQALETQKAQEPAAPQPTATLVPTEKPTNTPISIPPTLTPFPTITPLVLVPPSGSGGGGGGGGSSAEPTKVPQLGCSLVAQKPDDGQFVYKPGDSFDVEWVIKNTGQKTWASTWPFQYFKGEAMSPTAAMTLGSDIAPGDTVTLRIEVTAPNVDGRDKETFVMWWAIIGDGSKFCTPYIAIFVQK
ncbi:MAG: hypothetical protein GXP40_05335 [Chloroflexi bacterium]|nr:hypothetical protein [Chloroflexota bacterium]